MRTNRLSLREAPDVKERIVACSGLSGGTLLADVREALMLPEALVQQLSRAGRLEVARARAICAGEAATGLCYKGRSAAMRTNDERTVHLYRSR